MWLDRIGLSCQKYIYVGLTLHTFIIILSTGSQSPLWYIHIACATDDTQYILQGIL